MTSEPAQASATPAAISSKPNPVEVFGFACYDICNSSFVTVVPVFYAPIFVESVAAGEWKNSLYSLAILIGTVLTIFLSPIFGGLADASGRKKPFLFVATVITSVATACLWFGSPGVGGSVVVVIALAFGTLGYNLGEALVASFLPDIAGDGPESDKNMGFISAVGWATGYVGGLGSLVLVLVISGDEESDEYISRVRIAMACVGLFYLVFSAPTFIFIKSRVHERKDVGGLGDMFGELRRGFVEVRKHKVLSQFLFAYTVYYAGLDTTIRYVGLYARGVINMSASQLTVLFIILQFSAAGGALLWGIMEKRIGGKRVVTITIVWWVVGILLVLLIPPICDATGWSRVTMFSIMGFLLGSGIGSIQSSTRSLVGMLSPPDVEGQVFGFWGACSRVSTLLGTGMGPLADWIGLQRAMVLTLAFFIGGFILVLPIDIDGAIAKRHSERADEAELRNVT